MARSGRARAAVGAVLLALFTGTAQSQQPQSQGTQENPADPQVEQAEDHQPVPDASAQHPTISETAEIEPSAKDGNSNRNAKINRKRWSIIADYLPSRDIVALIFTGLVAAFTGLLTYFTYLLYSATRHLGDIAGNQHDAMMKSVEVARTNAAAAQMSANVAEATLIQTERPWIAVDIEAAGPLTYDEKHLTIRLNFIIRNVGHSPAMYTEIDLEAFINEKGISHAFDPVGYQNRRIKRLRNGPTDVIWDVIFPGSQAIRYIETFIDATNFKEAMIESESINPVVVGAVGYQFAFGNTGVHVTGFCYDVHRSDRPRPESTARDRDPSDIYPAEGDIPPEDLRFTASILGGVNSAD